MDLYAQPIPPEMAIQSSRVNLREALLQRLTEVQEKQQLPPQMKPVQESADAMERNLLIEMLEKSQKLQASSQATWTKEKQELMAQIRRLEAAQSKPPADDRREIDRIRAETLHPKLDEQPKAKPAPDKKAEGQLRAKVAVLERKLADITKAYENAQAELEQSRFLEDERRAYIESLEEQMRMQEMQIQIRSPEQDTSEVQTDEYETEKEEEMKIEMEAISSQVAGLHSVVQEQQELILSLKAARAASKPRPAATSQDAHLIVEQLLAEFEEQSLSFLLIKQEVAGLSSLLQTLKACMEQTNTDQTDEKEEELDTCKRTVTAVVVCLNKLKEIVVEWTVGKISPEDARISALEAELAMERKQKSMLSERIAANRQFKTSLKALLDPVSVALKSCLPALLEAEAIKQSQSELLSDLKTSVSLIREQPTSLSPTCSHIDQIEELTANLRILQDEFRAYKTKVLQDKTKFSEQLFKIAESLEYRKDLWEQLQNLEADEDQFEKLGSLSEELERQSEWESSNLALLITWMQESPTPSDTPVARPSISTIPEEAEDEESDDSRRSLS